MPNWVFNGLTIEGPKESVIKLKEQMNTPFVDSIESNGDLSFGIKQTKYSNPIFSFRNIIAPTDLKAYKKQPVRSDVPLSDPDWWSSLQEKSKTDNSWYNWNIRNWGVKWDVAVSNDDKHPDTNSEEAENGENHVIHYNFNTAWGIADKALTNLSSQYPDLLFTLSYEEETGWGGEMELLRGKIISQSEYHNMCRECDGTDCMEWCEECEDEVCTKCQYNMVESCSIHKKENA